MPDVNYAQLHSPKNLYQLHAQPNIARYTNMSIGSDKGTGPCAEHEDQAKLEVVGYIGNEEERRETALQAIKRCPKTLAWCAYALGVLTLSSYDNQAGGIFLSIPQFRKDFGFAFGGSYVLPAKWQSAYSGGPTASLAYPC